MDVKETVEYFRNMVESCGAYELCPCGKDDMETTKIALSALEKQIPKKPVIVGEEYIFEKDEWEKDYECSICGNPYVGDWFCSCCGQKLDWSDT